METQKFRDSLIDQAVAAFSRDKLDEAALEAFVTRVHNAQGEVELRSAAAESRPWILCPLWSRRLRTRGMWSSIWETLKDRAIG
jgi:hypothetical protein